MQTLIHNVEKLLRNHNFIALPGFGGFVATVDGSYERDGILYPPHKSVGFNPSLNYNDGLLAQEYATSLKISIDKANLIIDKSIEELTSMLTERGHFRFGSAGIFHRTSTGVEFEPSHKESYLSSSFGLVPVCFPIINPDVKHSAPLQQGTSTANTANKARFTRNATWVASVAAVILAFLLVPLNLNDGKSICQSVQLEASFAPIKNAFSHTEPAIYSDSEQNYNAVDNADTNAYHLIVASFQTESKAQEFIKELNVQYRKSCHILKSDNHYRVSVCSFSTESEGTDFLKIFVKDNRKFKDAWILTN
ncbi:MAG: SPOR domain-containing protein [Paludibacteraceae bacterium]|nr:SPOR domain-containing protein [Paludibacteraceae bacterium]